MILDPAQSGAPLGPVGGSRKYQGQGLPKSARLLKSRDFYFRPCERYQTENFRFFYTREGSGRLGVSLSKKALPRAVSRNRVRRLLREAFRMARPQLSTVDVHVVGKPELKAHWASMDLQRVTAELLELLQARKRP